VRSENKQLVLGITGASGAIYAVRLLEVLLTAGCDVHLSISPSGQTLLKQELGLNVDLAKFDATSIRISGIEEPNRAGKLYYHHYQDFMAPIASGSFLTDGMVICPCSGSTVSAIACGASNNLIQRAADVHLKERRPLILVPRETPLSVIQLDNLKRCAEAGAVVLPAMPGFYHGAQTIRDLVDFVVARICDQLHVEHSLIKRWGST
jgi:4-hydroxy-3-polyprenylbenzoate decarboxylase